MSNMNIICDNCGRWVQGVTWVNGMKFCAKCYQETFGASKDWQLLDKDKTIADLEAKLNSYEEFYKANGFKSNDDFIGYVINTMLNKEEKANIIKDLEAKLEEKEEQLLCKTWYKEYRNVMEANEGFYEECAKLREQLSEKEHSIGILNQHLTDKAIEIERLGEELKELKEYHDKYPYSYSEEYMLNNKELKQQLAEKKIEIENYLKVLANDKQFFMNYAKGWGTLQERQKQQHNQDKIELLEKVKDYFCEECEDGDGIKTGDWTITKDACEVAEYIDTLISEIKGEKNGR